jgi:hypothetical protein
MTLLAFYSIALQPIAKRDFIASFGSPTEKLKMALSERDMQKV